MHLSMRVPWMDRPWDGGICNSPSGNSSCGLLANIGPKRNDDLEDAHAGTPIDRLDSASLPPCLSERATFMSATGYTVVKTHPRAWNDAISVLPTPVSVPGYAFEAVPFRWLNRNTLGEAIGYDRVGAFRPEAEDAADTALGFRQASWVMDGGNQKAVIEAFFDPVTAGDSLVFIYLKHSPLQEARADRLLVEVAPVRWPERLARSCQGSLQLAVVGELVQPHSEGSDER